MSARSTSIRRSPGRPGNRRRSVRLAPLTALLALAAAFAMLALPLAAAGHHHAGHAHGSHGDGPPHGSSTDCSMCLWQAHHAADLTPSLDAPSSGASTALEAPADVAAPAAAAPACLARAPPCSAA